MITDSQIKFYQDNGYLVVADVLDEITLARLRGRVDAFVAASASITSNDILYDLEDDHSSDAPRVRRLKSPDNHDDAFAALRGQPKVAAILSKLWGTGVRFDKAKLNMKDAGGGAAVEWHQDWAFYPHTNDDLAAVGFMLDDVDQHNGPMMVVPGSHLGAIHDHHANGSFCGAVDVESAGLDLSTAVPLTGKAGSITIHHVRTVHGSAANTSGDPRRFLLHQYCAADAWPIGEMLEWETYIGNLVSGEPTLTPRISAVPVRLPLPPAPAQGSIYENQRALGNRYFG
ncbi:MAG: phytanoyl-CoA hydroxylase [Gammaproteobacteria bacterium]|jgi:phytanoyl-CoA hydroxylase